MYEGKSLKVNTPPCSQELPPWKQETREEVILGFELFVWCFTFRMYLGIVCGN